MKIVIVGAGTVGAALCVKLADEGHDITIVDKDKSAVSEIANMCDIAGVEGNGASISVLLKAGADRADLLIAVASDDEINILSCAAAKKLGTENTVAFNVCGLNVIIMIVSPLNAAFAFNLLLVESTPINNTVNGSSTDPDDSM